MSVNRNIFYTFFSQIPTQILSFLSGLFLVNLIGAEGRGVYGIILANIDLFAFFMGVSVNSGLAYFIPNEKIPRRKMFGLSLVIVFLGSIVTAILLWALYGSRFAAYVFTENHATAYFFAIVFAGFGLTVINTLFTGLFQGLKRFRLINQVNIGNSILNLTVFGGSFALDHYGYLELTVKEALDLTIFILAANTLIWLVAYLRSVRWLPDFRLDLKSVWKPYFAYIGPGHLSAMINFFNYRLDLWVLEYYYTSADVGIYAIAVGLAQRLWILPNAMSLVLMPHLSGKQPGEALDELRLLTRVNNSLLLLAMFIAVPISFIFFPLAYGAEFSASVLPFQLLLPGIFFSCVARIFSVYLSACGLVRFNLNATVIGLVVTFVFDFWLIPLYGAIGAGLATTATYFSMFAYTYYQIHRHAGIGWEGLGVLGKADLGRMKGFFQGKGISGKSSN
ncbi:MAG: flippase [Salibacteraceae bacterium]